MITGLKPNEISHVVELCKWIESHPKKMLSSALETQKELTASRLNDNTIKYLGDKLLPQEKSKFLLGIISVVCENGSLKKTLKILAQNGRLSEPPYFQIMWLLNQGVFLRTKEAVMKETLRRKETNSLAC